MELPGLNSDFIAFHLCQKGWKNAEKLEKLWLGKTNFYLQSMVPVVSIK